MPFLKREEKERLKQYGSDSDRTGSEPEEKTGLIAASAATAATISAAAAAAISTTATTTAAEATAPAAATTCATRALRASFIDVKRSAANIFPINRVNRPLAFDIVRHFNEGKAAGLTGITISDNIYTIHTAVRLEQRTDILFGCAETQVTNKNILHFFP
jgi:hypothetical protein